MPQPYESQPDRAFWKRSVAAVHVTQLEGLFAGVPGLTGLGVATAGSCFAQHMGRALRARGLKYLDYEPAPPFLSAEAADALGYGVYSCRYGNIYTARQLKQLFDEAFGNRHPVDGIWRKEGRYFDALRPGIEPGGFGSAEEVRALRNSHLERVKALFKGVGLFVFTLGLTEAWESTVDGTVYPVAPGVIAGNYDPAAYRFKNHRYPDVLADLQEFITSLRAINPRAKMLLTVSPVPLAATATQEHVLVATTYSKSVLRAVAGDLAADLRDVFYFPSYEVITGQPTRHMYYNPDLRTIAQAGVSEVMRHFFPPDSAQGLSIPPQATVQTAAQTTVQKGAAPLAVSQPPGTARAASPPSFVGYEHCEERLLDGDHS